LKILQASQETLNSTFATTGSNTFTGDQVIEGTNAGPGNTLQVEDGNGTPILSVQNATLSGFTNADVVVNGDILIDGIAKVQSAAGYGGGFLATNEVAAGNFGMNLGGDAGYSQALFSAYDVNVMAFTTDTNILFDTNGANGGKGAGNITFESTASINFNVNQDNKIYANGNMEVSGSNSSPGSTLQVEDGNGTPRLQVNNAALKGFTGVDVLVNGNSKLDGTVAIDDNTTINGNLENTGSLTNNGDTTIVGTNTGPSNTFTAKDGNGTSILQVNNATLKGFTNIDVVINGNTKLDGTVAIDDATTINGNLENTGSFTNGGDTTIIGTNAAPSQTFIAKNGTGTNRLEVNNATLSGLTSVDVNINGKTQITDTLTLQGDEVVNGTNTAPGSTFTAKDGNGTTRLAVQNATLAGLTGADILLNGDVLLDGTFTNDGDTIINGTNAAPGSTFVAKDGNSTNRLEVNNSTLSGFTGVDVNLNGTVQITETLKMVAQNPLPSGVVGELAVSGSALYFYDGAWKTVSLV
jgi:hypothetical protein